MKLRWSKTYPQDAGFDWGPDCISVCSWIYASRGGVHIALHFAGPGEVSEIDVRPLNLGLYACEVKCQTIEQAKRKAVQLVRGALKKLSKKWQA